MTPRFAKLFEQAVRAHQVGQLAHAAQLYLAVLAEAPNHAEAQHLLGLLLSQQGDHAGALAHLERAVALSASNPIYQNNLGEALRRGGRQEEAAAAYQRALMLHPEFAEAHYNLGTLLKQRGRLRAALERYQRAVELKPAYLSAHYNMGNVLLALGQLHAAAQAYERALALSPDFAEAHNNLGGVRREQEQTEQAIAHYRRALELKPELLDAHRNLSQALERQGRIEEARAAGRRVLELDQADDLFALHLDTLCTPIPEDGQAIDDGRAALAATIERYRAAGLRVDPAQLHRSGGEPPFVLAYQGRDDRPLKQAYATLFAGQLGPAEGGAPRGRAGARPHVGFVVTHGHEGVFLKCMRGILNHLPGERFQITVVCSGRGGAQVLRPAIANPAVRYLELPERIDQAAEVMGQARFDLLHYWEVGSDVANYALPFYQLAAVQCATWGWPVTSGIPQIQYFISSALLETPESDQHYSETLVRLGRLPTYYYRPPLPPAPRSRSDFGLPEQAHLYLCAQNLRKIHPDLDPLLAEILRRDPAGLVICIEDQEPHITALLRRRLQRHAPDVAGRIVFLPRMDEQAYLALTIRADVALDTLHYGAGANTCYDALAGGTPLVTLPGRYHRGRYAYAAYQVMGVEGCVAGSPAEYVELAVGLGCDPIRRAAVSASILRACPVLFEERAAVDELADFFEQALEAAHGPL